MPEARTGQNGRHALVGMFRQSVFGRLAGYEDVNDALRLRHDPTMRWIIGGKAAKGSGASSSQMGRFETNWLARPGNLATLTELSGHWIDQVATRRSRNRVVLDMDSSVSPTHGDQEKSLWNGHFGCTCYHPLFVFNQFGDLERCALRPGNMHSAAGWEAVLKPIVARYQASATSIAFRGDAAFAQPNMYEYLESEGIEYAIRLPANQILQAEIAHLLKRPVGRPAHYVQRFYKSFRYKAASWAHPRRIVAKVEWHPGELFPRIGFIVTNLRHASKNVGNCYTFPDITLVMMLQNVRLRVTLRNGVDTIAFRIKHVGRDEESLVAIIPTFVERRQRELPCGRRQHAALRMGGSYRTRDRRRGRPRAP